MGGGKIVDLALARNDRKGGDRRFREYHVDRGKWRMALAQDGNVYVDLVGETHVAQIPLNANALDMLISDLQTVRNGQRKYHERLRGAHLWIARPHATKEGWLVVKHADAEAPFRPVTIGKRRPRKGALGKMYTPAMPSCRGCGKTFEVGERAFEAEVNERGWRPLGRARICVGCTQSPREGLAEIEGGA